MLCIVSRRNYVVLNIIKHNHLKVLYLSQLSKAVSLECHSLVLENPLRSLSISHSDRLDTQKLFPIFHLADMVDKLR